MGISNINSFVVINREYELTGVDVLRIVLEGFILGLSLAAPPGPVNAVIASKSLLRWIKGFLVGAGALSADMIFLFFTIFFGGIIPEELVYPIGIIGSILLFYIAISVWRGESYYEEGNVDGGGLRDYATGLVMGLTNPFQIGWWLSAGVSLSQHFGSFIFVGFVLGILTWITVFPLFINRVGRGSRVLFIVKLFSFVVLLFFGVLLMYYSLRGLLGF